MLRIVALVMLSVGSLAPLRKPLAARVAGVGAATLLLASASTAIELNPAIRKSEN